MIRRIKDSLVYIYKLIIEHDKLLLAIILINNLAVLCSVIAPVILPRYIIDSLIEGKEYRVVVTYILVFSIVSITSSCASYLLKSGIYLRSMTIRFKLIIESGKKFVSMDYENFENPQILDLADRGDKATENNAVGIEGIMHKLANLGGNILIVIALLYSLIFLNVLIAILAIGLLCINYFVSRSINKFDKKIQDELIPIDRKWRYIISLLNDVGYYKDIYLFNMKNMIFSKIGILKQQKLSEAKKVHSKHEIGNNIASLINGVLEVLLYIWLGYLTCNGRITIGEYTMYMSAVFTFYRLAKNIIDDFIYISLQSERIEDFRNFMNLETKTDDKNALEFKEDIQSIVFNNVSFKYAGKESYALKDINIEINKHEKIAVVGLNGAGKTTFIKLLTKLYEPAQGSILFNDIDSKHIKRDCLYDAFSVVFQESNLFAFSVAENISMQSLKKTDIENVSSSTASVGLQLLIERLDKKYEHPVLKTIEDDGIEFSGGEIQKLSLARALYKNGQIMILDEPTASYDALAEERIYRQFNDLAKDKTVIYISHRLASTRFCDRILVFDEGEVVEEGTHEQLISQNGKYADLFNTQAKYYREELIGV